MRSPSTAMSAERAGAPVPSTTDPPRITRSCMDNLLDGGQHLFGEGLPRDDGLLAIGVDRRTDHDEPVDAELGEGPQPLDAVLGRPDDPEAVDEPLGELGGLRRAPAGVLAHV